MPQPGLTIDPPISDGLPKTSSGQLTPISAALMSASANFSEEGFLGGESPPIPSPWGLRGGVGDENSPPLASPKPLPGRTPAGKAMAASSATTTPVALKPINMNGQTPVRASVEKPKVTPRAAENPVSMSMPSKFWGAQNGAALLPNALPEATNSAARGDHLADGGDNIKVVVRVRPMSESERELQGGQPCVRVTGADRLVIAGGGDQGSQSFSYDLVAGEGTTQQAMFDSAGRTIVENCLSGYNSCMFAYGQTGSGKTHTMLGEVGEAGSADLPEGRGLTPRVFEHLFRRVAEKEAEASEAGTEARFLCRCSFLEIYNETISDLLNAVEEDPLGDAAGAVAARNHLQIREGIKHGVFVEGLTEEAVTGPEETAALLARGSAMRRVAETNMNRESSRSHSVFTCVIESRTVDASGVIHTRHSRLNLVDLAGSERQRASGAQGERLKEASSINKSLSTLGHVIMSLVDISHGKARHVPYRDSRLTYLLQESLGGNAKTIMIANVSPASTNAQETLSTLKFAQRAKFIRNKAVVNEDTSGDVAALKEEVARLKRELTQVHRAPQTPGGAPPSAPSSPWIPAGASSPSAQRTPVNARSVRGLEKALAGALRREAAGQAQIIRHTEEVEKLEKLCRQREGEVRQERMVVRFRDERIKRLEAALAGQGRLDAGAEVASLREELAIAKERAAQAQHPEVTRFAAENLRLAEQLRTLSEKSEPSAYDKLLEEVSVMRERLEALLAEKEEEGTPSRLAREREEAASEASRVARLLEEAEAERTRERERLTGRAEAFEKVAEEKVGKVEQLSSEVTMAREQLKAAAAREVRASESVQALEAEVQALRSQVSDATSAAEDQRRARTDAESIAEARAGELEAIRQRADAEAAALRESAEGLGVQLTATSSELSSLRDSNSSLGLLLDEARAVADGLRASSESLAEEKARAEGEREDVAGKLAAALEAVSSAEALRLSREGELVEASGEAESLREQVERVQVDLATALEKAEEAAGHAKDKEEELEDLKEELEVAVGWRATAEGRKKELVQARADLDAARAELEEARAEASEKGDAAEKLAEASAALGAARAEMEAHRAEAEAAKEALEAAQAEAAVRLAEAGTALDAVKVELEAAKVQAAEQGAAGAEGAEAARAELAAARESLAAREAELAAATKALEEQGRDLETTRETVAAAAGELGEAARGGEALRAELEAARAESDDARDRCGELETQLEARDRELVAARQEAIDREAASNEERERLLLSTQHGARAEAEETSGRLEEAHAKLEALVEERERWLAEMHQHRTDASAARERAHGLESSLAEAESRAAKADAARSEEAAKVEGLETEVARLAGQQNLNQRIHHHAKIKEENNALRKELETAKERLSKQATYHERAMEDLARYRAAAGQAADLDIDEEARLRACLDAAEAERADLSKRFASLAEQVVSLSGVAQGAAGASPPHSAAASSEDVGAPGGLDSPGAKNAAAQEALRSLRSRLVRCERELDDHRSQVRLLEERERLNGIRKAVGTPMTPGGMGRTSSLPMTPHR